LEIEAYINPAMSTYWPSDWPTVHDLTLAHHHVVWCFSHQNPEEVVWTLEQQPKNLSQDIPVHVKYAPALACFDIQYWHTMDIQDSLTDPAETLRARMYKKYMQNVRLDLVDSVCSAPPASLVDGSWVTCNSFHEWSIRTCNMYSHSPFVRSQYEEECRKSGRQPYQQRLDIQGERQTIHFKLKK
jgi:hypothetical protein